MPKADTEHVSYKPSRTWVWVLLIVLFAILVTGGVAGFVLTRDVSVSVENKEPTPVQANILETIPQTAPRQPLDEPEVTPAGRSTPEANILNDAF